MSNLNERIDALIKALNIRKTAFAERLNVSQAFISQLCSGIKQPSDRTIADICDKFGVNEIWLRTGEGDMFCKKSISDELNAFFADVMNDSPSAKSRLILSLSRLSDEQWDVLETVIDDLAKKKTDPQ